MQTRNVLGIETQGLLIRIKGVIEHLQPIKSLSQTIVGIHRLRIEFGNAPIHGDGLVDLACLHHNISEQEVGLEIVGVLTIGRLQGGDGFDRRAQFQTSFSQHQVVLSVLGADAVMLDQIKEIQITMDNLDREAKKRESNIEQLEKCRNKYQELTKEKLQKP